MSRSNWLKVLQAANLTAFDPEGECEVSAVQAMKPISWVCANALCRAVFMRMPFNSEYCPTCLDHLKEGRPDLLDPKVYAECQRVAVDEKRMPLDPSERKAWLEEYHGKPAEERLNPRALWRELIGLPPLVSDVEVDPVEDFKDAVEAEEIGGKRVYKNRSRHEGRYGRRRVKADE